MPFTKNDVEELSNALGEPGWVLERRLGAWRAFESAELPGEKDEPWRYTDLRRLRFSLDSFARAVPRSVAGVTAEAQEIVEQEGDRAGYLIQRDADVVLTELDPAVSSKGVIFTDIATAIAEHGDLVKEHLFNEIHPGENIFSALHGALFCGGTFLYVPRGVTVELAFESQRWIDLPGAAVFPHTLVVAEEGAEVVYFERLRSPRSWGDAGSGGAGRLATGTSYPPKPPGLSEPALSNGAVEIVAGQGSRVTFVSLQEYGEQVWHFQTQRAISHRDVTLRSLVVTLGGRFSRVVTESIIRGQGSFSEMLGLYFAEHGQHFDHRTLQNHVAGGSTSDLLYKGALKDDSRAVYSGLIRVEEDASKTNAYQANRNLVLSDHAKADSKPELEIKNNDLRCTHGATVSQINEEELFYLQTRGLDRVESERLIVNGFFEETIGRVKIDEIRKVLHEAVERKLG